MNGRCGEAVEFYKRAIGAEVQMMMRFSESPEPMLGGTPEAMQNKIMHASLKVGDSVLMASDGHCDPKGRFEGFSLSLNCSDIVHAESAFKALGEGGKVTMPLGKTFWAERFSMLTDAPSPVVQLDRAVAIGMAFGPHAGLEAADALLTEPWLADYHLLPSVRGDLLRSLSRMSQAARSSSALPA